MPNPATSGLAPHGCLGSGDRRAWSAEGKRCGEGRFGGTEQAGARPSPDHANSAARGCIAAPTSQPEHPHHRPCPALPRGQPVRVHAQQRSLQEPKHTGKSRQQALSLAFPSIFSPSFQTSRWFSLSSHEASKPARLGEGSYGTVLPDFPHLQVTFDLQTLPPNRRLLSPPPRELFSIKQQPRNIYSNFFLLFP